MNIVDKANLNQHSNRIQDDPLNDNPEVDFDTDNYIYQSLTYDQPLPPETEDGQSLAAEGSAAWAYDASPGTVRIPHRLYL